MLWWKHIKKSTREQEERFKEDMEEAGLTTKDKWAIVLSAFLTILLPCLLILTAFGLLIMWMFGAF